MSAYFLSLPIAESNPLRRYDAIQTATAGLKDSRAAEGIDLLTQLADRVGGTWLTRLGGRVIDRLRPYNLIVTNVAGTAVSALHSRRAPARADPAAAALRASRASASRC